MMPHVERYSGPSRALHWLTALIIFSLIGVGLYMTGLDEKDPSRLNIYALHKSMGVLTLLLLIVRIAWLRVHPGPVLPAVFTDKEKLVTKGVQSLLYVLLFLVPVAGYVMSNAEGHSVSFFGMFDLPSLVSKSESLGDFASEAHELMAYSILGLVALHMAGAIKHRLTNKGGESDVLARML